MFLTLIFQYLNKLVKSEVRDLTTPEAFHPVKVQRFGGDKVKSSTQVGGKFPMPVFTLVADFAIETCEFSDGTPPIVRAFDFTRKAFVEVTELFQRHFQGLWVLYLLTRVQGQVGIHTKIYPYAFTCSKIGFGRRIVSYNIEPIRANGIPKDLDIADFSVPIAVLMEREPAFIKRQSLCGCVPRFEREPRTSFVKFVACFELRRAIASFAFELRKPDRSVVESTFISDMDTDNRFVKRVAWYPCPVWLGALEQLRQMRLQAKTSRILTIAAIIAFLQLQEVVMHIAKVIKQIPCAFVLRMFAYLIFIGSQDFTSYQYLTPYQVGRQTHCLAAMLGMSANWSK